MDVAVGPTDAYLSTVAQERQDSANSVEERRVLKAAMCAGGSCERGKVGRRQTRKSCSKGIVLRIKCPAQTGAETMSPQSNDGRIGVDTLLELTGTDRAAKAYAFLYAAFSRTTISQNPVRDALDCLMPFIVPYLNNTANTQLKIDGIKQYLSATYGFDIPLYAIEQLVPSFQRAG